jgi:hypothetical protein
MPGFHAYRSVSFTGNGERNVSMRRGYGFEIVHARRSPRRGAGAAQNKTSAHQLKIYAK